MLFYLIIKAENIILLQLLVIKLSDISFQVSETNSYMLYTNTIIIKYTRNIYIEVIHTTERKSGDFGHLLQDKAMVQM